MSDINKLINDYYNTDKGYKYIIEMLELKYPTLKLNYDNLDTLIIENMTPEEFYSTGFIGEYTAKDNKIKIFTNLDSDGNKIINTNEFNEEQMINTFIHELIHASTTKVAEDGTVMEGINLRYNGQSSLFLGLNEGITQMITDGIMNTTSDAYPFEENFAKQLSTIFGEEELVSLYSNNNYIGFANKVDSLIPEIGSKNFLENTYYFHMFTTGRIKEIPNNLGTTIQQNLIELYKKSGAVNNEEFLSLVLDEQKVEELMNQLPLNTIFYSIDDIGFNNIEEINLNLKGSVK